MASEDFETGSTPWRPLDAPFGAVPMDAVSQGRRFRFFLNIKRCRLARHHEADPKALHRKAEGPSIWQAANDKARELGLIVYSGH